MAKVTVVLAARAALRSALLLIPFLAGASCRQAICSGSMTCLELQVKADSFPGVGKLEVVLVGNSCNVLARYNQASPEATGLPERVEVRLDDPASFPPLSEPVARVVVLARPMSGLPWSGTVPWPQEILSQKIPLSVELFAPQTKLNPHSPTYPEAGVTELVAITNAESQHVLFLGTNTFGHIPVDSKHELGVAKQIGPKLPNNASLLKITILGPKIRASFLSSASPQNLEMREIDFSANQTCDTTKGFNHIQNALWGLVINSQMDSPVAQLLYLPDSQPSPQIVSSAVNCIDVPQPDVMHNFPVSISKLTFNSDLDSLSSAAYPTVGPTSLVAIIDSENLIVLGAQNLTKKWSFPLTQLPSRKVERSEIISLAFVDTKQSALPSIAVGTKNGELFIFRSKNDVFELDPSFVQPIKFGIAPVLNVTHIKLGDFNGDTLLDVALAADLPISEIQIPEIQFWFGDGHGQFVAGTPIQMPNVVAMDSLGRTATAPDSVCADDLIVSAGDRIDLFSVSP